MVSQADLAELKDFLVAYGGGYLRNTVWDSEYTCGYCTGIPSNPNFTTCYQCGHEYRYSQETSDLRGFVSYGWDNSQSATVMYGYKNEFANRQAQRVVHGMLFYAIHEHRGCTTGSGSGEPTMWATVPSLRQRGHPQVLNALAAGMLRNWSEARMAPSDDVRNPRSFRPENFVAPPDVSGQHVLLVDDTWATGGHGESAAAALKRAGAARVTLLVLARWLNMGRGRTDEFVKDELTADFDPDLCPFDRC
jgi:hypothetical protein